jgi:uncharacterized protein (TIGR02687 family)
MNVEQIKRTLEEKFAEPQKPGAKRHLIFWYDPEAEFLDEIEHLSLENAKLWRLEENNNFLTKYTLEVLDPDSNYLIYSPYPKPTEYSNWLLDTLLYSTEFNADKVTLIMTNLGVIGESLRPLFRKYEKFFNSKERTARFSELIGDYHDEERIDKAILAVLAKQRSLNFEDTLRAILIDSLEEETNTIWEQIVKFGDLDTFWQLVEKEYNYTGEKRLKSLLLAIIVTTLGSVVQGELPDAWKKFETNNANCIVFLDHFMNHKHDSKRYDKYADEVEAELHLREYLKSWKLEDYQRADLLRAFDEAVIRSLLDSLHGGGQEYLKYKELIRSRRTSHFYPEFKNVYSAIYWAIQMLEFKDKYRTGIPAVESKEFLQRYTEEYFQMDQAYRKFCFAYSKASREILKQLNEEMENLYTDWFLQELSVKWSEVVAEERANWWPIAEIEQQMNFYRYLLQPLLNKNERVFVIISDALRFEAAQELAQKINTTFRGTTSLSAMQGVIPSYTQLGMAALLPHSKLELSGERIIVDGNNAASFDDRLKILTANLKTATAMKLEELLTMDRNSIRDTFRDKKNVYIYHNNIDATGDDRATEARVFTAVEDTFTEIMAAVELITKSLNTAEVYITADHGFLYRRSPLDESDKTKAGDRERPLIAKRRFFVYEQPATMPGTIGIKLDYIFGKDSNLTAVVPRANNRFKTQGGGQNYVHGGASLQEIVIPLIKYKRGSRVERRSQVTKVDVRLTSSVNRITNSIFSLDFFQSEKIADKKIPRTLKIYFIDDKDNKISNEGVIIADLTSDHPGERMFRLSFTLKDQQYDKTKQYFLVMEDPQELVEKTYERISFTIDFGL